MRQFVYGGIILLCWSFTACKKEAIEKPSIPAPTDNTVWVINEGNYTWGNASVTLYDPFTKKVNQDAFEAVNGRPLGDVAQSMTAIGELGYIVVNNSANIEIVDLKTLESKGSIEGFASPRHLLQLGDGRAYVSDLYANKIFVVDLEKAKIVKEIAVSGWIEQMLMRDGYVYVANMKDGRLDKIDPLTDAVVRYIPLQQQPAGMVLDAENAIWVLCDGGIGKEIPAMWKVGTDDIATKVFSFTSKQENPSELTSDTSGSVLYYLNEGVYRLDIHASSLPASAYIQQDNRYFYSLGIHPQSNNLYVGDAKDYVEQGEVLIYDAEAKQLDSFEAGVIPGFFCFMN